MIAVLPLLVILVTQPFIVKQVGSSPTGHSIPRLSKTEERGLMQHRHNSEAQQVGCSVLGIYGSPTKNGVLTGERWKEFPIYIDSEYNYRERRHIYKATRKLARVIPCIKFFILRKIPLSYNGTFIHLKKNGTGCASYVGKQPKSGAQVISLDTNCVSVGTIIHEMIHALGFLHEQSRPDRDLFVTINWENIQPEYQDQFWKYDYSQVTTFGIRYNAKSIMHYSSYAFSLNGKPTIVTTTGRIIGRNEELQRTDIIKLNRMYNC